MSGLFDEDHILDRDGTDIHGEARGLRECQGPVAKAHLPGGGRVYVINGYRQARQILAMDDSAVSTNPRKHWNAFKAGEIQPGHVAYNWSAIENAFSEDGSEHKRLRRLIGPAFSAHRIKALEGTIGRVLGELLEDLHSAREAGNDPVDLRARFTSQLPLRVLCELVGIPQSSWEVYEQTVAAMFATGAPAEAIGKAAGRLSGLVNDLIAGKSLSPGEDMISALLAEVLTEEELREVQEDGAETAAALSPEELLQTIFMIIGAGWETTVGLLNHTVRILLLQPRGTREDLCGTDRIDQVIREVLRLEPPLAMRMMRAAVEDVVLDTGGTSVRIPKGAGIVISYAGVGRDPETYGDDADAFDPDRSDEVPLLSFGRGAHYCVGAALAKLQARLAIPALFQAFPDIALAVPAPHLPRTKSCVQNDVSELPVHLTA